MIQAIDKHTIHKICSGQVVVDLATAVKELVENSLDSGATVVEVKLRNMGIDSIEVCDNGNGIDPSNFEGIAMKHCTSKLKDFEDVYSVSTFGFRGEALNSLCELSGAFSVVSKQANSPVGAHLQFDQVGRYISTLVSPRQLFDMCNTRLISQRVVARSVGTSVLVERLFEKLPVRRGELVR
jgi:DNA mismatch repair protein PMS2